MLPATSGLESPVRSNSTAWVRMALASSSVKRCSSPLSGRPCSVRYQRHRRRRKIPTLGGKTSGRNALTGAPQQAAFDLIVFLRRSKPQISALSLLPLPWTGSRFHAMLARPVINAGEAVSMPINTRDLMSLKIRWIGACLGILGVGLMILVHWMVFFWVPTERSQGVVQRIFYIHLPAAVTAFLAFGIVAVFSALYLRRKDVRFDMAALSAAEGGMVYTVIVLLTGPLWGRVAWGAWWVWDPKLTLTLLLWFIYLGYFLVRASTGNSDRGKRFAAVLGIVGVLDIPLIYFSVVWFRSMHPGPVVMRDDGPSIEPEMLTTLFTGFAASGLLFLSLLLFRYRLECARRKLAHREMV